MIISRINTLINTLSLDDRCAKDITTHITLYLLKELSSNELRKHLTSNYNLKIKKSVIELKLEFLDCTAYTLSKWWRAACAAIEEWNMCQFCSASNDCSLHTGKYCTALEASFKQISKTYGVTERDILLIKNLDVVYIQKIKSRAIFKNYDRIPSPLYYNDLIKRIHPYCKKLVNKQLRFICKHNHYDTKDLIQELLKKALEVILEQDHKDPKEILAYTRKAVQTHAIRLLKFYTQSKRARLIVQDGELFCTTICIKENQEYGVKQPLNNNPEAVTITKDVLDTLLSKCNSRQKELVRALTQPDKDFFKYLKEVGKERHHSLLLNDAATYYQVPRKEVREVGKFLKELMAV